MSADVGSCFNSYGGRDVHTLSRDELLDARDEADPVHIVAPEVHQGSWD